MNTKKVYGDFISANAYCMPHIAVDINKRQYS